MSRRTKKLRILIAESDFVVRRGFRSLLEDRPDWKICGEAATGAEAIEKARALHPHLLLLDVAMPDMEVAEVIAGIVTIDQTVKVVALATEDSAELAANALAAGALGITLKSEAASELSVTLEKAGKGQGYLSSNVIILIGAQLAKRQSPGPIPANLSAREFQILQCLASGQSNKVVAAGLGISVKTVNAHRANIMRKLALRSYRDLIRFAIRHGINGI